MYNTKFVQEFAFAYCNCPLSGKPKASVWCLSVCLSHYCLTLMRLLRRIFKVTHQQAAPAANAASLRFGRSVRGSVYLFVNDCVVRASSNDLSLRGIIIIIIIKDIYIAQVRKGHKCAMSAEMAAWLRNCLYVSIAIYITNCQDS